jgi:parallel beta-helix repeat protein
MQKKQKSAKLVVSVLALAVLSMFLCFATAGSLEPSAAPGPTMKTLDEVEPRTPVESLPGSATALYVINQPGSYYLTGNITGVPNKNGIEIASHNVTLDLAGFALIGDPNSWHGVWVQDYYYNIAVVNGAVRNWGWAGVDASRASSSLLRDLRASDNGADGILIRANGLITRCTAMNNGGSGIYANGYGSQIIACEAFGNKGTAGIGVSAYGAINDCISKSNTGNGFRAGPKCSVVNCTATANAAEGIYVTWTSDGPGAYVTGCTVAENLNGIIVHGYCRVTRNHCLKNRWNDSTVGILVAGSYNHIEDNTVTYNDYGIKVDQPNNLVIGNRASNNAVTSYSIAVGNAYGQVMNVAGGGSFANTDPTANFIF